ncbi:MAG: COX15/CtaA family protein [Burkholderiaceae bacterium]|jgi:cytochrome c oxidase assembly protein subunit 15|nr:COX15/CtaA family protein [Aquabacterium sp.]NUP84602.1 COX15/CtaA family protein [Burkholderiaceae bacterium]
MKLLLALAAALTLIVAVSSAMLRLSLGGAGCTPWPACYETRADHAVQTSLTPEQVPGWHRGVRLAHRVTASLAGLLFLMATLFGWRRWSYSERCAALVLLAVSVGLALLGRYTPSPLPVVVQANLLGGHLLLAALGWMLVRPRLANHSSATTSAWLPAMVVLLMVLVLAQAAIGGLVSARSAAAACQDGNCPLFPSDAAGAFDSMRSNASLPPSMHAPQRQAVLQLHTVSGALTVVVALVVAWGARRSLPGPAMALATVAVSGPLLGWLMRSGPMPLAITVLHSLLAAVLLALATGLCRRLRRA